MEPMKNITARADPRATRYKCDVPGRLRTIGEAAPTEEALDLRPSCPEASLCDLSVDGFCLVSREPLPIGTLVRVDLRLPGDGGKVPALAEVCWTAKGRAGMRILALTEEGRRAYQRYLFLTRRREAGPLLPDTPKTRARLEAGTQGAGAAPELPTARLRR